MRVSQTFGTDQEVISVAALRLGGMLRGAKGISGESGMVESEQEGRSFAGEHKVIVDKIRMASGFVVSVHYGGL